MENDYLTIDCSLKSQIKHNVLNISLDDSYFNKKLKNKMDPMLVDCGNFFRGELSISKQLISSDYKLSNDSIDLTDENAQTKRFEVKKRNKKTKDKDKEKEKEKEKKKKINNLLNPWQDIFSTCKILISCNLSSVELVILFMDKSFIDNFCVLSDKPASLNNLFGFFFFLCFFLNKSILF